MNSPTECVTNASAEPVRTLKIEEHGDRWKAPVKPKIRLIGRWLELAGFKPGKRVQVKCVSEGVIELRSQEPNDLSIASVLTTFVPLSEMMKEQLSSLRAWARGRARPATSAIVERKLRRIAA